ncbi:glycosyltransferase [Serratia fonticola]|uniref:glycosyltransferase n=1 Tax=Serratia fonticola TaxID=47917 RepID=UPI0015C5957B|nr:glycosyltransferase [Serratia fonticola]MBC3380900.1 glycosyltransferase [Serratia fonticola]NYA40099.1 glycosyltransferase [Serratia fonticola]
MSNILILSHTQGNSDFKIGSHHYANGLSKLGYEVFYSGIPKTIFHKLFRKQKVSSNKLDSTVSNLQIDAIFPLTMPMGYLTKTVNPCLFTLFERNRQLKKIPFQMIICDSPFFYPLLRKIKFDRLYYRPTDNYQAMVGEKAGEYERKMCEESKVIICTSQTVAENIIKKYSVNEKKVKIITNGYDSEHFFKIDTCCERKNALYIGALDYRFDFEALSRLAQENKEVIFDIYGPIENKYKETISKIEELGNVFFHGNIDYRETNEVMNKYKVGLLLLKPLPSNLGRSPMKLWEYLASGLNVIYSNLDNMDKCNKLFRYENYEDMMFKFNTANSYVGEMDEQTLYRNSWREKVIKINTMII